MVTCAPPSTRAANTDPGSEPAVSVKRCAIRRRASAKGVLGWCNPDGPNAQLGPTALSGQTFSSPWKSRMHAWGWPSEGALNRDAPGLLRQRRWAGTEQKLGPAARATAIETLQIHQS